MKYVSYLYLNLLCHVFHFKVCGFNNNNNNNVKCIRRENLNPFVNKSCNECKHINLTFNKLNTIQIIASYIHLEFSFSFEMFSHVIIAFCIVAIVAAQCPSNNPCKNGGTCIPSSSTERFYCKCATGWEGLTCSNRM